VPGCTFFPQNTEASQMKLTFALPCVLPACAQRGVVGAHNEGALLQTWDKELEHSTATPVTRVVNLLKEISGKLKNEMDEDEELYSKLECWCNTGKYEKQEAIAAGEAKMEQLTNADEQGAARSKELDTQIKELTAQIAADKQELATATKKREEELQVFQGLETDSIQAVENLKAALVVLSKHHDAAFPQLSLLAVKRSHQPMDVASHSLEGFMQSEGLEERDNPEVDRTASKFLQQQHPVSGSSGWSTTDVASVRRALKQAAAFAQLHGSESYYPSYNAQSGEIVGILKTLKEQMEGDLKGAQEKEAAAAGAFADMRAAKAAAIAAAEKMEEQKEDEKAETDNLVAEAKEDLGQTDAELIENQKFLANLNKMCSEGDSAFESRKSARLDEIQAVAETIEILTADEAKDAMAGTYSFLQTSTGLEKSRRKAAAALIRSTGIRNHDKMMAMLATSVELDAFTKVKKAIDDMISTLKQQTEDEVKKNDYCKAELQENEMDTAKTEDLRDDLNAKIGSLESKITTLGQEISDDKAAIQQAQMDLQRASEDRKRENNEFQNTIADQAATIEVLHKALDRLAQFYDDVGFAQLKQTPPVAQKEYKPNAGASGVMSMIEKLITDAKDLMSKSRQSENEAQQAYEALVGDTNASVDDLSKAVASKTKATARAKKDKINAEGDLADTMEELEGLFKYNADLHAECDYTLKNFEVRQKGRAEEIESLQQAKQILNGADLS